MGKTYAYEEIHIYMEGINIALIKKNYLNQTLIVWANIRYIIFPHSQIKTLTTNFTKLPFYSNFFPRPFVESIISIYTFCFVKELTRYHLK